MGKWELKPLGSMCVKIGSGATPTGGQESYKDEGISLIRSQNVDDFVFLYDGLAHIDDEQARKLNNVIVEANDTLINITGDSVARVCFAPKNVIPARVNQHVAIIRADNVQLDNDFTRYSLLAMKEYLLSISEIGATRRALTKSMLENLDILTPDIGEQRAIAEVLSSLDDKIDLLTRQNATLEALAQTYFQQWFEKEELNGKLGDLCSVITKGTTPTTLGFRFAETGLNFIKAESINDKGDFLPDKFAKIDEKTNIALKRSMLQENDVLCSIAGTIGRIGLMPNYYLPANTNQAIAILRTKPQFPPEFVYLLMKSPIFQDSMQGKIVHSVQPNLSLGEISNTKVPIPTDDKIKKLREVIAPMFTKKRLNNAQIVTLQKLRDTLLPKLISGEVRVKQ